MYSLQMGTTAGVWFNSNYSFSRFVLLGDAFCFYRYYSGVPIYKETSELITNYLG